MQSTIYTALLVTSAAAVSYIIASSEDMGVACADGNLLGFADGNLLATTVVTGGTDGAACSVVRVDNRASPIPTAPASAPAPAPAPASAPPTVDGFSFVL